jgi:hypothetical protein
MLQVAQIHVVSIPFTVYSPRVPKIRRSQHDCTARGVCASTQRVRARIGVRLAQEGGGAAGQLSKAARLLRPRVADGDGRDDQVGDLDPDRTRAASSSTRRAAAGVARGQLDGTLERVCVSGGGA